MYVCMYVCMYVMYYCSIPQTMFLYKTCTTYITYIIIYSILYILYIYIYIYVCVGTTGTCVEGMHPGVHIHDTYVLHVYTCVCVHM